MVRPRFDNLYYGVYTDVMTGFHSRHPIESLGIACDVMRGLTPFGCTRSRILMSPEKIGDETLTQGVFIMCGVGGGLCRLHELINSRLFELVREEPVRGCPEEMTDEQIKQIARARGVEGI